MAITSLITVLDSVNQPSGYAPAALTAIDDPEKAEFTTDVAIANADAADPATGLDNIQTAVKNYFDTDFALNKLKLDATATINANIYIKSIERVNTASSIYLTGTEVFRAKVIVHYE